MIERAPFLLSLLTLPLLAGMIFFIVVRRPRQPMTWGFAGVMAGLILFYLGDLVLYRPGLAVLTSLIWQFVSNTGANVTIFSAVVLNIMLRQRQLERWEWAVSVYILVRMLVVDFIWLPSYLRVDLPRPCEPLLQGGPRLVCASEASWAIASGALTAILIGVLYISTALKAPEPRRHILRRYIVWIVLLIVGGSLMLHVLSLLERTEFGVFPSQPLVLLATVIGLRLFLALEEQETGIRLSRAGRGVLLWLAALIVAAAVDLNWSWVGVPMWTLATLAVGIASAGAYLVNALIPRPVAGVADAAVRLPAPVAAAAPEPTVAAAAEPAYPLRIWLLGGLRVARNGEALPNTNKLWRSAKARSLLAYLALRGPRGATQLEIVDALWPVRGELNGEAERQSLAAFRSYLSTLRHVLEPDGPRGSDRFVALQEGRYRLRPDSGVWVDVWEFEALVSKAEKQWAAGRHAEAVACWERALALYPVEGLLPDEEHVPPDVLWPTRERLRQRWLLALRRLAGYYAEHGPAERVVALRSLLREAQQLEEAT